MERSTFLDNVLKHYAGCYDIVRNDMAEGSADALAATAEYHEHDTGYALIRKAEMWSADRHEYVWFYSVPELTEAVYDSCYAQAYAEGLKKVDPTVQGHMSSMIVIVFICDQADDAAVQKLCACRERKNYKFGINGWMEVHTAAAILGSDRFEANSAGRNEKRFLTSIMHPVKKQHGFRAFMGRLRDMLD